MERADHSALSTAPIPFQNAIKRSANVLGSQPEVVELKKWSLAAKGVGAVRSDAIG